MKYFVAGLTLYVSFSAIAGDDNIGTWLGSAKLGFILTKASTKSLSVNTATKFTYEKQRWKQSGELATYYSATESSNKGANKNKLYYSIEYLIPDKKFVYLRSEYERDRVSTYRNQFITAAGFGGTLIDAEQISLYGGIGPGYRYSQRQVFDPDFPGRKEEETVANAFIDLNSDITDELKYSVKLNVDYGNTNTSTTVKAQVKNQLVGDVALVLDVEYIYNSVVAKNDSKNEIYSTVSINYDF